MVPNCGLNLCARNFGFVLDSSVALCGLPPTANLQSHVTTVSILAGAAFVLAWVTAVAS